MRNTCQISIYVILVSETLLSINSDLAAILFWFDCSITHKQMYNTLLYSSPACHFKSFSIISYQIIHEIQWNLDLSFFKGVEKTNNEYGEMINPENHFFFNKKGRTLSLLLGRILPN
jgi:hypothetical protein